MSRELDVKVARALGQSAPPTLNEQAYVWRLNDGDTWIGDHWPDDGAYGEWMEVSWPSHHSTNIAAAWELDGEGWQWVFDEIEDAVNTDGLDVLVWNGKGWHSVHVAWKDFPSKAEAYATGRCLAWLKAMEATDGA